MAVKVMASDKPSKEMERNFKEEVQSTWPMVDAAQDPHKHASVCDE